MLGLNPIVASSAREAKIFWSFISYRDRISDCSNMVRILYVIEIDPKIRNAPPERWPLSH